MFGVPWVRFMLQRFWVVDVVALSRWISSSCQEKPRVGFCRKVELVQLYVDLSRDSSGGGANAKTK